MHSLLSSQLGPLYTLAMIALSPKGKILFRKIPFGWIKTFSLPRKMIYEIGHVMCVSGSRCDDRGAFGLAAWDFTGWTLSEQIVELRLRHFQHFWQR